MLTENICQGIASEEAEHGSAQLLTPQLGDIRRSFTFRWVVCWCVVYGVVRTVQCPVKPWWSGASGVSRSWNMCSMVSIENIHC